MSGATWLIVVALLFLPTPARAQVPVTPWADVASYGTAVVNPTIAVIDALRGPSPTCHLARLALSEAIGNAVVLTLKHFVVSPRPCLGCAPDGVPSGHTMNSTIGFSARWRVGLAFSLGTAELRTAAQRHTPLQVAAGFLVGAGADAAGHLIRCQ